MCVEEYTNGWPHKYIVLLNILKNIETSLFRDTILFAVIPRQTLIPSLTLPGCLWKKLCLTHSMSFQFLPNEKICSNVL